MTPLAYFDGHCDSIDRCLRLNESLIENSGHVDLSRASAFSKYTQIFAMYCKYEHDLPRRVYELHDRFLLETERASHLITHCRTGADILASPTPMCALLSIEGAELIGSAPERLEEADSWGVRLITLTWNRANGVSGAHQDQAERGLSDMGREFMREMQRREMLVDVSHLSERGFWDVMKYTEKAVVASHSNARAVCDHTRNVTDKQICAIAESGGVVGVNLYPFFLGGDASMERMLRHVDHLLEVGGEQILAIGADLDGFDVPGCGMRGIEDIPMLWTALKAHGYDDALLQKMFYDNWLRVF